MSNFFVLLSRGTLLLLFVSLLSGCGRKQFSVAGKVTLADGRPLTGGMVLFEKVDTEERISAQGSILADGTYRMGWTAEADGLPEGKYVVMVTPELPRSPDRPPPDWPPFNPRFSGPESPLSYTVVPGNNVYNITVEK